MEDLPGRAGGLTRDRLGLLACASAGAAVAAVLLTLHQDGPLCVDDPITRFVAIEAGSSDEILSRAALSSHPPTYFFLMRAVHELAGEVGLRLASSYLPWFGAIAIAARLVYGWTGSKHGALASALVFGSLPQFILFALCLRPYAWATCLLLGALRGVQSLQQAESGRLAPVLVGACAGLLPHASLTLLPVALGTIAWAAWLRRTAPSRLALLALSSAPPLLFAVTKAAQLLGQPAYHAWMEGAPWVGQLAYPLLTALLIVPLLVRAPWRGGAATPALRTTALVLATIALVHSSGILVYRLLSGVSLYAPRYHVPDLALGSLLGAMSLASLPRPLRLVVLSGLCAAVPLSSHTMLGGLERRMAALGPRNDAASFVDARAQPRDLVLVISAYTEARHPRFFREARSRAYLLADMTSLRHANTYPAAASSEAPTDDWLREVCDRLHADSRIWLIRRVSWDLLWNPGSAQRRSGAEARIAHLGFVPADAAIPDALRERLLLLERRPDAAGRGAACRAVEE